MMMCMWFLPNFEPPSIDTIRNANKLALKVLQERIATY